MPAKKLSVDEQLFEELAKQVGTDRPMRYLNGAAVRRQVEAADITYPDDFQERLAAETRRYNKKHGIDENTPPAPARRAPGITRKKVASAPTRMSEMEAENQRIIAQLRGASAPRPKALSVPVVKASSPSKTKAKAPRTRKPKQPTATIKPASTPLASVPSKTRVRRTPTARTASVSTPRAPRKPRSGYEAWKTGYNKLLASHAGLTALDAYASGHPSYIQRYAKEEGFSTGGRKRKASGTGSGSAQLQRTDKLGAYDIAIRELAKVHAHRDDTYFIHAFSAIGRGYEKRRAAIYVTYKKNLKTEIAS